MMGRPQGPPLVLRGPRPWGAPGPGQVRRRRYHDSLHVSSPPKLLDSARRTRGPPWPDALDERPLVSSSEDQETIWPPLPPSLHPPLAARLASASRQACQSLAEGPRRLWLPDRLDITCHLPLQEPWCHKGMTWPLHPVRVMVPPRRRRPPARRASPTPRDRSLAPPARRVSLLLSLEPATFPQFAP